MKFLNGTNFINSSIKTKESKNIFKGFLLLVYIILILFYYFCLNLNLKNQQKSIHNHVHNIGFRNSRQKKHVSSRKSGNIYWILVFGNGYYWTSQQYTDVRGL